jgi:hypothetical protein
MGGMKAVTPVTNARKRVRLARGSSAGSKRLASSRRSRVTFCLFYIFLYEQSPIFVAQLFLKAC